MEIVNIRDAWGRLSLRQSLPRYEPFVELAARPRTEIAIGATGYLLFRRSSAKVALLRRAMVHEAIEPSRVCAFLRKGEEVTVSVDLARCYTRQVKLPLTAMGKIGPILDLDVARVTPFARDSVFAGWIHDPAAQGPDLNVEHIIIRKDIVADIVEAIRGRGAKPVALIVRDGDGSALPLALAIDGSSYGAVTAKRWTQVAAFSLVLLGLGMAAFGGAVLLRQSRVLAAIAAQSADVAEEASGVRKQLEEIKSGSTEISALQARKSATAGRAGSIEELSRILPDDVYLDGVSFASGKIVVDGAAASPEQLISALESSPLFQNVSFASPVFKIPDQPKSQFSIKLELETRAAGN